MNLWLRLQNPAGTVYRSQCASETHGRRMSSGERVVSVPGRCWACPASSGRDRLVVCGEVDRAEPGGHLSGDGSRQLAVGGRQRIRAADCMLPALGGGFGTPIRGPGTILLRRPRPSHRARVVAEWAHVLVCQGVDKRKWGGGRRREGVTPYSNELERLFWEEDVAMAHEKELWRQVAEGRGGAIRQAPPFPGTLI